MSEINIRTMYIDDYPEVSNLWNHIKGFGIRSIDDSREGIEKFLERNRYCSVVAECDNKIVGTILCGHDGRYGNLYHVCVAPEYRQQGIGKAMVAVCMNRLRAEGISVVSLVAYQDNAIGNAFWFKEDFKLREDLNRYDFILNDENITRFISNS